MSKKILFDLDNTLVGSYRNRDGVLVLEPRPGVLELLEKLRKLRNQEKVEYILFTNVPETNVGNGVRVLDAENFFDDIISRETHLEIKPGSVEEKIFGKEGEFAGLKPFSVIEGDILLVEDNPIMQKAGESVKVAYEIEDPQRKIEICKVTFYEPIDPKRYDVIKELEDREEKTEFDEKRLTYLKKALDNIVNESVIEMEKVYDEIVNFFYGISVQPKSRKEFVSVIDQNDFELQIKRLIDLHF